MAAMSLRIFPRVAAVALAATLAACASAPKMHDDGALQREAMAGTELPAPAPLPLNTGAQGGSDAAEADAGAARLSRGSGQFIRPGALTTPRPAASGQGAVTLNFENQPIQAVVKAILGDLLKANYTITPGVEGSVSFSTAQPVDVSQALPILETLLSWTGNAVVLRGQGYVVLPQKDALAGSLVPSLGAAAPKGGLQARLFPLRYISAPEMQKLVKPFARPDATLLVDPARNVLVMAGTPEDLANYQNMVRTFDVDWLRGMSVGVFNLEFAQVAELMPKLDGMFGPNGNTPLAGMLRFIPIERTNALVVISTQPDYLAEVGEWIRRIDRGGGNQPQLFVYDVRNVKASDLARYLAQIYTGAAAGGGVDQGGQVAPGLSAQTLGSAGTDIDTGTGTSGGFGGGFAGTDTRGGSDSLGSAVSGSRDGGFGSASGGGFGASVGGIGSSTTPASAGDQQYASADGSIRISSVDGSNQLLVRARPSQWDEIRGAIAKLDNVPLQVQIETRILEVGLTGEFQFGVQWYLQGLAGSTGNLADGSFEPGNPANPRQGALGQGGNAFGGEPLFYSFVNSHLQVALRAMETSGNTKTLSAPSMVVMNNQIAHIAVGQDVPINQTSVSPGVGTAVYSQATYKPVGVILDVQPRVNPGGLVYMNIAQQVSQVDKSVALVNGNPTIQQRQVATQIAVQSGQTVLLGGLIQQGEGTVDTGIPGLNRIPVVGRLFGGTTRSRNRTELIVLITPRIIRSGEDARSVTEDYQRKFQSLAPLLRERGAQASAPAEVQPLPDATATTAVDLAPAAPAAGADAAALQRQAEAALAQSDYVGAQTLALRSWRAGNRHGELCRANWQVIANARRHLDDHAGAETAEKWQKQCLAGTQ